MDKKMYCVSYFTWIISIVFALIAVFLVIFSIIVIPQILTMDDHFSMILLFFAVIGLSIFVVYAALLLWNFPRTSIELSEEGVVFDSNGYRIYTPWDNIAGIGWTRLSRSFPSIIQLQEPAVVGEITFGEGIASRRAVSEKRRWWMSNRQLKAETQYTHYIRIPVVFFRRKDKQEGTINQYLWYYLPHLMENR